LKGKNVNCETEEDMGIETAKKGSLLYHLTELDNLDSIIKYGMLPRKTVLEQSIKFKNVANKEIITKRTQLNLDKYTPFHFHPYSAFDVAVKHTYYGNDMIYMCITRELAKINNFKILPKHPLSMDECMLYSYDEGFSKIDWDTLMEINRTDEYAKQVKMAECLTEKRIAIELFQGIYVQSDDVKEKVSAILNENNKNFPPPYINVQKYWFLE
jgi:hypothetical protein